MRRCLALLAVACWTLVATACSSIENDLSSLSAQEPLPYSVLVTGGAYLGNSVRGEAGVLASTFAVEDPAGDDAVEDGGAVGSGREAMVEAVALERIMGILRGGRVFVRVEQDPRPTAERAWWSLVDPPRGTGDAEALLDRARAEGHDLVLAIERLRDGPVARQGVNGRWPVTLLAWLAVGLGLVIPDHTYESSATLSFSLRDVQSGEVLVRAVRQAGAVDLSLVERSDMLGIFSSILIPPFLVWDDDEDVVDAVRSVTERRLLLSVASRLKGVATLQEIRSGQAVDLRLSTEGGTLRIDAAAPEGLAGVRLRLDGEWFDGVEPERLWAALQASVSEQEGRLVYQAGWTPPRCSRIQVVVQTLSGRLASSTVAWGRR